MANVVPTQPHHTRMTITAKLRRTISMKVPTKLVSLSSQLVASLRGQEGGVGAGVIATTNGGSQHSKPPTLELPDYLPSQLTPGILHVGAGNFFRSHLAAYMHDLLNDDKTFEANKHWGIVACGVRSDCFEKREKLLAQDWLQTVVERDAESEKATIVGSMIDYMPVDYLNQVEHVDMKDMSMQDAIKIVSLTVTEGGYFLDNGVFNPDHPALQRDIANPELPQTVWGILVRTLRKRRDAEQAPFTVLSCDNLPHNGDITRNVLVEMARRMYKDDDLADWIDANIKCPNSMVDRITPATTDETRQHVRTTYGYDDAAVVFCEPFRQWVLEDNFGPSGRPDWHQLETVKLVPKGCVGPHELRKIRILNGGHATLSYPAALLGVKYVHEAVEHPSIAPFLDKVEREEIIPTVPDVPNDELSSEAYWETTVARFANPYIKDTIVRNCFDGASRQPKFIVPVAADALKQNGQVDGLALVSALWCRYCQGTTADGQTIAPNDPQWDRLQALAVRAKNDPTVWLDELTDVYGTDVAGNNIFRAAFVRALQTIEKEGVDAALKAYVNSGNKSARDS